MSFDPKALSEHLRKTRNFIANGDINQEVEGSLDFNLAKFSRLSALKDLSPFCKSFLNIGRLDVQDNAQKMEFFLELVLAFFDDISDKEGNGFYKKFLQIKNAFIRFMGNKFGNRQQEEIKTGVKGWISTIKIQLEKTQGNPTRVERRGKRVDRLKRKTIVTGRGNDTKILDGSRQDKKRPKLSRGERGAGAVRRKTIVTGRGNDTKASDGARKDKAQPRPVRERKKVIVVRSRRQTVALERGNDTKTSDGMRQDEVRPRLVRGRKGAGVDRLRRQTVALEKGNGVRKSGGQSSKLPRQSSFFGTLQSGEETAPVPQVKTTQSRALVRVPEDLNVGLLFKADNLKKGDYANSVAMIEGLTSLLKSMDGCFPTGFSESKKAFLTRWLEEETKLKEEGIKQGVIKIHKPSKR